MCKLFEINEGWKIHLKIATKWNTKKGCNMENKELKIKQEEDDGMEYQFLHEDVEISEDDYEEEMER